MDAVSSFPPTNPTIHTRTCLACACLPRPYGPKRQLRPIRNPTRSCSGAGNWWSGLLGVRYVAPPTGFSLGPLTRRLSPLGGCPCGPWFFHPFQGVQGVLRPCRLRDGRPLSSRRARDREGSELSEPLCQFHHNHAAQRRHPPCPPPPPYRATGAKRPRRAERKLDLPALRRARRDESWMPAKPVSPAASPGTLALGRFTRSLPRQKTYICT